MDPWVEQELLQLLGLTVWLYNVGGKACTALLDIFVLRWSVVLKTSG